MIFKKHRHYCTPFPWFKFYKIGESLLSSMEVLFDDSIRYDIGEDQSDVNKLFGFSYGWHHQNSDRIGFRYVPSTDDVEIVLYSYQNGKRLKTIHICNVKIWKHYFISFRILLNKIDTEELKRTINIIVYDIENDTYEFCKKEIISNSSCWGYTLGGYFGGNRRAPHKITIHEY